MNSLTSTIPENTILVGLTRNDYNEVIQNKRKLRKLKKTTLKRINHD